MRICLLEANNQYDNGVHRDLLCIGLVQGFTSGVLGAGGGWIMPPVQYWVYEDMGIASAVAIRMAFAPDLFMILPATAASALGLCMALAVPCRFQHNHDAGGCQHGTSPRHKAANLDFWRCLTLCRAKDDGRV